ncbi:MAG: aryl-sulfate sulfotransferase, partial [Mariniphaga sp.]
MILQFDKDKIRFGQFAAVFLLITVMLGCNNPEIKRPWIRRTIPFLQQNLTCRNDPNSALRQIFTFQTDTVVKSFVEYWQTGKKNYIFRSDTSSVSKDHRIVIWGLKPECDYSYRIVIADQKTFSESEVASFKTSFLPVWLDSYYTSGKNGFKINGKLLISNRKDPGMLVLLDSVGNIEWYNAFTRFLKTAWYTQNNTFLFILSDPGYKTTYGNHLLEMNLNGDTLLHFTKDSPGFRKTFHHETLLDQSGNVVVLTAENR